MKKTDIFGDLQPEKCNILLYKGSKHNVCIMVIKIAKKLNLFMEILKGVAQLYLVKILSHNVEWFRLY
jgi:hypothetical protein